MSRWENGSVDVPAWLSGSLACGNNKFSSMRSGDKCGREIYAAVEAHLKDSTSTAPILMVIMTACTRKVPDKAWLRRFGYAVE